MQIKEIGAAAKFAIIEISCDCGRKGHAVVVRWHVPQGKTKEQIIEGLRSQARFEDNNAQKPRIWQSTRTMHENMAASYRDLANKLEEEWGLEK